MNVRLLDCTLRDGGHINDSNFGEYAIKTIISDLIKAKTDIIEIGFLRDCKYNKDKAIFPSINSARAIVDSMPDGSHEYALMLQEDQFNWKELEVNDGTIQYIRVSFHNYDLKQGFECCKKVIEQGYKCFINPINLPGYSDLEILHIISKINEIMPYGFTIVDTFGGMKKNDLARLYYLLEHNLNREIVIGIHLHENLSLAYSLAQNFLEIKSAVRSVVIDGSLYGMGRVPGNLCIELIMDYLNETQNASYMNEYAYDAIDEFIMPIKDDTPWGYSSAYALSAQFHMHRSYAEYLLGKKRIGTKDIKNILSVISENEKAVFKKDLVEQYYWEYMAKKVDDSQAIYFLKKEFSKYAFILIIAPGGSINKYEHKIKKFIWDKNPCVVFINFYRDVFGADYVFFANARRYKQNIIPDGKKIILSSNLLKEDLKGQYVINYNSLITIDRCTSENSTVMFLNLLTRIGINNVVCAGFDGFKGKEDFGIKYYDSTFNEEEENHSVEKALNIISSKINLYTITPSMYETLRKWDEE